MQLAMGLSAVLLVSHGCQSHNQKYSDTYWRNISKYKFEPVSNGCSVISDKILKRQLEFIFTDGSEIGDKDYIFEIILDEMVYRGPFARSIKVTICSHEDDNEYADNVYLSFRAVDTTENKIAIWGEKETYNLSKATRVFVSLHNDVNEFGNGFKISLDD